MITNFIDPIRVDARKASHANYMTDSQFDVTWDMVGIVRCGMQKSGKFSGTLDQMATVYALGQRIPKEHAELILRDQYKARFGETLKQTLDGFRERESVLRVSGKEQALHHAERIEGNIKDGATRPYYMALDVEAVEMSSKHGISETAAKSMMKEAFQEAHGRDLYEHGKALEQRHHTPVREAENAARKAERQRQARSGPQM